jgi:phage-related protein (TIGR01555 family)
MAKQLLTNEQRTLKTLTQSITVIRDRLSAFLGFSHKGRRDLYDTFGYPRILTLEDMEAFYKRGGIAKRIIRAYPQATWRDCPMIKDDTTTEDKSEFEKACEDLFERLHINWYMERTDRLANLGEYALLLMGFADGEDLMQPLTEGSENKLLYLTPYKQRHVIIDQLDTDTSSERYGLPLSYTIHKDVSQYGRNTTSKTLKVHHSRILHVADGVDDNEIYGTPRLQSIFNHLMDLQKVVGGGAETYWLNARPGMSIEADKDANLSTTAIDDLKTQAEEFEHQLRRIFAMQGASVKSLAQAVADPTGNVDAIIKLIAGTEGIPVRILTGSEAGELASSQDENNWNSRIEERRENFATPMMLKPFIEKLIRTGNLPQPKGSTADEIEFYVEWPEISALSPKDKAEIAGRKATALKDYETNPGAQLTVPPQEFRQWIGEEAESEYEAPELPPLPEPNPVNPNDPANKTPAQQTFNRLKAQRRKVVKSVM